MLLMNDFLVVQCVTQEEALTSAKIGRARLSKDIAQQQTVFINITHKALSISFRKQVRKHKNLEVEVTQTT